RDQDRTHVIIKTMAWLSLEERDDSRKKVRIGTRAVLGRSTAVDIALQHKDISREHACIEEREGLFFISDMGSTNGTFVNGSRLKSAVALRQGDEIRLGSIVLRFHDDGLDEETNADNGTTTRRPSETDTPLPEAITSDPEPRAVGKVGRFALERILGKGGMGEVYLGQDLESSETVAVKFIRSQIGKQEAFLEFFHRREAAIASCTRCKLLKNVPVRDTTDLYRLRAEHATGCEDYAHSVERLIEAAHYASNDYHTDVVRESYHEILPIYRKTRNQGSTHQAIADILRDRFCTEGNWYEILGRLASEDRPVWVKITDFGISFRADDEMQHNMGTPRYMSPERVQ
ncbi:MAG: FHA domain-containing protein kinase, partial [Planctomycetes bacterium]|nr:FHA domain-containing protein kinase [Planctomycetota bacterium]